MADVALPPEMAAAVEAKKAAGGKKHEKPQMHVKVYAPFKVYFDGQADSISAINDTGPFDILPHHHNFMTLLSPGDIVIRYNDGEDRVAITKGVMHVKSDEVIVFLDV